MAILSSSNERKAVLIVAVDFGTTYSGVSYAFSDDVGNKYLVRDWPSSPCQSDKVPTRISYSQSHEVQKWGFEIKETDARYQEFKLCLDPARKAHHSSISQRYQESSSIALTSLYTPTRVSIDYLRELRKSVEVDVDKMLGAGTFSATQIEFVITVPAIWSDQAKDLTNFCAEKAGMGSPKLISEPEAAMVHVLEDMSTNGFTVGDTFVVCDAGGGTVDLITYKVTSIEPLEVEEVVTGDGDRCGSAYVTRLFREHILQNYAILPFWTEEATAAAMECFEERAKRKFDDKDTEVVIKVRGTRDCQKHGVKIIKQKLFIPSATVKNMFDQVVPTIFGLIKEQRRRAAQKGLSITGVVLVGGFCESPYLRQYLRQKLCFLDKNIKIIIPQNGWSAVVRGALSRALPIVATNPLIARVTARNARVYYGITNSRPFNPRYDPEGKRFWVESLGQWYIECIFWFLAKGCTIRENYQNNRNYEHSWDSNSTDPKDSMINLKIVSWDSTDENARPPMYPNQPGVELVNNLNVDLQVIPNEERLGKWRDDKMYYECYPDVRITYHFATIKYQLFVGDKCYGEVSTGIEE